MKKWIDGDGDKGGWEEIDPRKEENNNQNGPQKVKSSNMST